MVRRNLGIQYSGDQPEQQAYLGGAMVSTYLRVPDLHSQVIRRTGWQYWTVNRDVRSNTVATFSIVDAYKATTRTSGR